MSHHFNGFHEGRQIKYRPCPKCSHNATLLVHIQEHIIHLDAKHRRNYYCTFCHYQFQDERDKRP